MVRIAKDLDDSIEGEDVLLVEDIVDTGFTLRYLLQTLAGRAPNSLAVCTFLDRNSRRIVQVPVNYRCSRSPTASWWGLAWIITNSIGTFATWRPSSLKKMRNSVRSSPDLLHFVIVGLSVQG